LFGGGGRRRRRRKRREKRGERKEGLNHSPSLRSFLAV
jgi:hypothetical protein